MADDLPPARTRGLSATGLPAPVAVGRGRTAVRLALAVQGRDLILTVTGGAAHVGAVAVVAPARPSQEAPYCSLSVVPGHAEGSLAEEAAARIAAISGRTCVAIAGIHQDQATRGEIETIVANVQQGLARLEAALAAV